MQAHDGREASYQDDLALIVDAAAVASGIAMDFFGNDEALDVQFKPGDSPVSAGDFAVDDYLRKTLLAARPDYGWLSEETTDQDPQTRLNAKRTFVVDPIDGTKAYISGGSVWCVSIAVVEAGKTIAGVLACPVLKQTYAASLGHGAFCNGQPLSAIDQASPQPVVAGRRSLVQALEAAMGAQIVAHPHVPSLAYRIAMIADGRLSGTFIRANCHDWDIAAAALILRETGGDMVMLDGVPTAFNALNPQKPDIVAGHPTLLDAMIRVAAG